MIEKIKKSYYYFYYKIYKFIEYCSEELGGAFWSDFKASISIVALEIWTFFSIIIYTDIMFNGKLLNSKSINKNYLFIILIILVSIDYFSFHHKDRWKHIILEFDRLPKEKNKRGSWIVFGVVFLLIANLIFSFYLLYADAKRNHTGPYAPEVIAKDSLQKAQQIENLKKIYGEDKK